MHELLLPDTSSHFLPNFRIKLLKNELNYRFPIPKEIEPIIILKTNNRISGYRLTSLIRT